MHNGAGNGCGDRTDQNVVVAYVRQFVSNDSLKFFIIHQFEQTLRHGHRGVARISSRGEGVGRLLRNDIQLRHWQIGFCGESLHHLVQSRQLFARHRFCAARP